MDAGQYVAFLSLIKNKSETNYMGAVLVTDFFGVPMEFRCTHPVKPTEIQKQLYGSTLDRYIGVELCGKPLLGALQRTTQLIIVSSQLLLAVREGSQSPVLLVRRAGEVLNVLGSDGATPQEMKIDVKNRGFESITVRVHESFPADMDESKKLIGELIQNVDPLEPFDRIAKAVEALSKQDSRFQ